MYLKQWLVGVVMQRSIRYEKILYNLAHLTLLFYHNVVAEKKRWEEYCINYLMFFFFFLGYYREKHSDTCVYVYSKVSELGKN